LILVSLESSDDFLHNDTGLVSIERDLRVLLTPKHMEDGGFPYKAGHYLIQKQNTNFKRAISQLFMIQIQ